MRSGIYLLSLALALAASSLPAAASSSCFAYRTKGGDAFQIACYPDAAACSQVLSDYRRNPSVEAIGCAPQIYCFTYNPGHRSSACYLDGNQCVTQRNLMAGRGGDVGLCVNNSAPGAPVIQQAQGTPPPRTGRAVPPSAGAGQQPAAAQPGAGASALEPAWPQRFELGEGESTGFGFAASQPGRITVSAQWQGVPLVIELSKPNGATLKNQGAGSATLEYEATADDIRNGVLWSVRLYPAQAQRSAGASGRQVFDRPIKIDVRAVASGSVNVQHPAGDMQRAQAEINARAQAARAQRPAAVSQQAGMAQDEVAAQRRASLANEAASRHMMLLDQMKGRIPVEVHQNMTQQISLRAQGRAAPIAPVYLARAAAPQPPVPRGHSRSMATSTSQGADTGTGTSGSGGGAQPVGTTQAASVAAGPAIASLSVSQGDPGTPVMISGSGFSETPGEVHFIVANGKDLVAPVSIWSDTQIFAAVPDITGVMPFNGQVYVQRGAQKSRMVSFQFQPTLDSVTLGMTRDRVLDANPSWDVDQMSSVCYEYFVLPWGGKGNDEFYRQMQLKNGWIVDRAYLYDVGGINHGNAYITDFHPGTNSPYVKVHWWADPNSSIYYTPHVVIVGPKGVPYQ